MGACLRPCDGDGAVGGGAGCGAIDDGEDPEAALRREVEELRREAADRQAFVAAVQGALDHDALRVGLERARTQLEDHR